MRLGILGGGQLGKMTAMAAAQFGIETVVWSLHPKSPAAKVSSQEISGDLRDLAVMSQLGDLADVVTLENEFIDAEILQVFCERGTPVFPLPQTVAIIQDKWRQKSFLRDQGLPVPPAARVATREELGEVASELGFPLILKTRRLGYDGRGTRRVDGRDALDAAFLELGGERGPDQLLAEAFVPFDKELAVMVVQDRRGQAQSYPVVETRQPRHICESVLAPADVPDAAKAEARRIAVKAVERLDGVGAFGVELFWTRDGQILINEIAPRPHNSGHYTIEACVASQFENHVRAVVGFDLAPTDLITPAAVMINLLGTRSGRPGVDVLRAAGAVAGAHLHWYGKRETRPGRKMGHVTALGATLAEAEAIAARAAQLIDI